MHTIRQSIKDYLTDGPRSLREISQHLRISEKDALDHLEHIQKMRGSHRLAVTPASCNKCGFLFTKRQRLGRPSRCPVCRSESISGPLYEMDAG